MNMKRICYLSRIKEEMRDIYIQRHKDIPKELEALYKKHGIMNISCFLHGEFLIIYQELDMDLYEKGEAIINESEISKIFHESLKGIDADVQLVESGTVFEEVYHLE